MLYLVGGAPRVGKTILAQRLSRRLPCGWISTDLLATVLRAKQVAGLKTEWDATPAAIRAAAEWFWPCLEEFAWGVSSMAEHYVIEGVDFLPEHAAELASRYALRAIFLGCSQMTLERFDEFPGHSRGYSFLSEAQRRQFARDVPLWSDFIRAEAEQFGQPYLDMGADFPARLREAEAWLAAREE